MKAGYFTVLLSEINNFKLPHASFSAICFMLDKHICISQLHDLTDIKVKLYF